MPRLDPSTLPAQSKFPDADAIVLKDSTVLRFRELEGEVVADETRHVRQRVFREAARGRLRVEQYYSRAFSSVEELVARATMPDGETKTYTKSDAADVLALSGFETYSDSRALVLVDDGLPLGTTMEWRTVLRGKSPELWAYTHCFDDTVPTAESTFEVIVPKGMSVDWVVRRDRDPLELAPTESTGPQGEQTLRFEMKDIPPLEKESYAPAQFFSARCVHVRLRAYEKGGKEIAEFGDAEALSRWTHALMQPPFVVDRSIQDLADEILEEAPDDKRTRAALLYAWARDAVKYCAIEVGIGGFQPHPSTETARFKYGDCKDKANVLRALLSTEGITSDMVTIYSHQGYPKRFVFPVLGGNFNHAILAVHIDNEIVLADPTHPTAPFGDLPFNDEGADYLRLTETGVDIATSAFSPAAENIEELTFTGTIDEQGVFSGTIDFRVTGEEASRYRLALLYTPQAAWPKALGNLWSMDPERITDVVVENATPPALPMAMTGRAQVKLPRVLKGELKTRLFGISTLVGVPLSDLVMNSKRISPALLGFRRTQVVHIDIALPKSFVIEHLPNKKALDTHYIGFDTVAERRSDVEGSERVVATRTFTVKEPIAAPDTYRDVVKAVRAARMASGANVVLAKNGGAR